MLQPRIRPLASVARFLLPTPVPPSLSLCATYASASASRKPAKGSKKDTAPVAKGSKRGPAPIAKGSKRGSAPVAKRSKRDPAPVAKAADLPEVDLSTILRTYVPRTPGVRHLKRPINDHLWKGRPLRSLTFPKKGQARGGRNNSGRITVRHRGGGHKRRIRTVDFERKEPGPHLVERIEYDPNRSAHIALLTSKITGKKSYIVAADGMRAGDIVHSYRAGIPRELIEEMGGIIDPGILASKTAHRGNCLPMHMIPVGTMIYCIALFAGKRAQVCRSAGTYGVVTMKEEEEEKAAKGQEQIGEKRMTTGMYVHVRLQSGEIRKIGRDAVATIGVASNVHYNLRSLGKAGRSRWLGIRPTVRGLAMNSVDHPHGGGRGKSKGNRIPVSPWGTPAKSGYKTRKRSNINKYVVVPRVRNMGKRRGKAAME